MEGKTMKYVVWHVMELANVDEVD